MATQIYRIAMFPFVQKVLGGLALAHPGHSLVMLTILLIVLIVFLLFGGGGYYYRGRGRRGL